MMTDGDGDGDGDGVDLKVDTCSINCLLITNGMVSTNGGCIMVMGMILVWIV